MGKEAFRWNGNLYAAANKVQAEVGERLISRTPFSEAALVLDVGCGSGNLTFKIGAKVPKGRVTAIDLSESMIRKCKSELAVYHMQNVEFEVRGIHEITDEDIFDIVFSNSVLHWITDIQDAIDRFYRALKSKGVLSVQFPLLNAGHPLIAYAERAIKELGVQEYYKNWRFPWYVPKSAASFSRVLTQAGFMDVRVIPESNRCVFDSPEEVYRHFISVGLELYAARFPGEMRDMFMDSVKQNIQRDFPQAVTLKYERLFASGKK